MLHLPKFVGAAQGYITTDYSSSEEMQQVLKLLSKGKVNIEKATIPIEGAINSKTLAMQVIPLSLMWSKTRHF